MGVSLGDSGCFFRYLSLLTGYGIKCYTYLPAILGGVGVDFDSGYGDLALCQKRGRCLRPPVYLVCMGLRLGDGSVG